MLRHLSRLPRLDSPADGGTRIGCPCTASIYLDNLQVGGVTMDFYA